MGSHKRDPSKRSRLRARRRKHKASAEDEFVQIRIGMNRFRGQVIAEACRAAGLRVQLLRSDDSGYGNVEARRLLVRSDQLEQVMAIIERSDSEIG